MKTMGIVFIVLAVSLCSLAFVQGDQNQNQDEAFYKKCIDEKIAKCERKCKLVHSRGNHLQSYGEKKGGEAQFYKENKENLVKAMV
ncbi:MAG: hypothetical protein ACOC0H_02995, partial [Thermodesulfobacteriota bacterium]